MKNIYDLINAIASIVLILSAGFAIYQYYVHQKSEQIKYTYQFVTKLNEGQSGKAIVRMSRFMQKYDKSFDALAHAKKKKRDEYISYIMKNWDDGGKKGVEDEIIILLGFYDDLYLCIEASVCNQKIAFSHFGEMASALQHNFDFYIQEKKKTRPNFGKRFLLFTKEFKKQ